VVSTGTGRPRNRSTSPESAFAQAKPGTEITPSVYSKVSAAASANPWHMRNTSADTELLQSRRTRRKRNLVPEWERRAS
jgi:hypothetical protein